MAHYPRYRLAVHWSATLATIPLIALLPIIFIAIIAGFVYQAVFVGSLGKSLFVLGLGAGSLAVLGVRLRPIFVALSVPDSSRVELRDSGLVVLSPLTPFYYDGRGDPAPHWRWPEKHFDYTNLGRVSEPTTEAHFSGGFGRPYPLPAKAGHVDIDLIEPVQGLRTLHLGVDDPHGFRSELMQRVSESAEAIRKALAPAARGPQASSHGAASLEATDADRWSHLEPEDQDH